MSSIFRIGDIQIKDSSGVVEHRNASDTAYIDTATNRLHVHGDNATDSIILDAPAGLASSPIFFLPGSDGTSGQVLQTDGSGVLSFVDQGGGSLGSATVFKHQQIDFSSSDSTVTLWSSPTNNVYITSVIIIVATSASGGSPDILVGTSTDTDKYVESTEVNLLLEGIYEKHIYESTGATPEDVILTITPDGQTFSGRVIIGYLDTILITDDGVDIDVNYGLQRYKIAKELVVADGEEINWGEYIEVLPSNSLTIQSGGRVSITVDE